MAETRWTKGPWVVKTVPTSAGVCHRVTPEAWGDNIDHGGIALYDDHTSLNPHPEWEQLANAHLIAAAPDLYEALERVEDEHAGLLGHLYHVDTEVTRTAKIMRTALAKARGEGA